MARLECNRGWGKVYDPETDRDVSIGEDISPDLAERMAERYGPIEAVDLESNDEPVNPTCIGNDGECSRTVDEPGTTCWQH